MANLILEYWDTAVIGVLAFAAGNHLGQAIGFNDGLRRAWEIMNEAIAPVVSPQEMKDLLNTARQSPLGDKPKT